MITVEKIGGTSMTQFKDVLNNIVYIDNDKNIRYGRVFVVSAYGGVTNLLLENKKTQAPGIYQKFASGQDYEADIENLLVELKKINETFVEIGLDLKVANDFISERINKIKNYLYHMAEVIASGYVEKSNILLSARELLASIGETHSVFNSVNILQNNNINSIAVDLSGFHDKRALSLEERIHDSFNDVDVANNIVVATGYTKSAEGIMREFDRGYSEVTFSRVAVELQAEEAIIHKEFHLSSADPNIVGEENAIPIGNTNFDVADQLADVGMEAIHPKASKPLEISGVKLRIKNTFEPNHPGTIISKEYKGTESNVEVVTGTKKAVIVNIHDSFMVGSVGVDLRIGQILADHNISYILKATNANTISIGIWDNAVVSDLVADLEKEFSEVNVLDVAIICVIGSNIAKPGVLAKAAQVLSENNINILCVSQSVRQTNMQFVIEREEFENAIKCLNNSLCIEN